MSIPTINNPTAAADSRSPIRQTGTQPGTGNGVGENSADTKSSGAQSDAVSISNRAADLQSLESRIRDLPDVDANRVATLRESISAGRYQVDSASLANKLLAFEQNL